MKNNFENINEKYIYGILTLFAIAPVLIFAGTPPFADDYSWLNFLGSTDYKDIAKYFNSAGPFGFYRPLFIIMMKVLYLFFGANYIPYRILAGILNVFIILTVYRIMYPRFYTRTVSFFTSILFTVLAVHSEVLFIANCLNILLSDFFILTGIYYFINSGKKGVQILPALFFILSLLLRESSVYYIPLVLVFYYFLKEKDRNRLINALVLPLIIYGLILLIIRPENYGNFYEKVGGFDLSVTGFLYKFVHFTFISFFPVKIVFYITGFEYYDNLRSLLIGNVNKAMFFVIAFAAAVLSASLLFPIIKKLKSRIIFPILIFISAISVYLTGFHVAERFVFLAALGTSIITVLFITGFKNRKLSYTALVLFILLHLSTLILRGYSYDKFAKNFITSVRELHGKVQNDNAESNILVMNLPAPTYGQVLISALNYNDAYRYFFPLSKKTFYLMNCLSEEEKQYPFSQTFTFNPETFTYSP